MAGTGKNLVFASRAAGNSHEGGPTYVEGLVAASAALLPGFAVHNVNGDLVVFNPSASVAGGTGFGGDPLVLDINAIKQGNMSDAWVQGDTGVAIQPRAGQKLNMRTTGAFTCEVGTPLTINANGNVKTADTTEVVYGYADEILTAVSLNSLVRVRWALGTGPTLVA